MDQNNGNKKRTMLVPTRDEQQAIHQIENVFRMNLIHMQVKELLNQVNCDHIWRKLKVQQWLQSFTEDIKGAWQPKLEGLRIDSKWLNDQSDCFKQHALLMNQSELTGFMFQSPQNVDMVGSSIHCTGTFPMLNLDITITIPDSIFQPKDILNHVYFDKRFLYLVAIAVWLQDPSETPAPSKKKKTATNKNHSNSTTAKYLFEMAHFKGDIRKPIFEVKPSTEFDFWKDQATVDYLIKKNIRIRLIPVISPNTFKLMQLRATKNNVRPPEWKQRISGALSASAGQVTLPLLNLVAYAIPANRRPSDGSFVTTKGRSTMSFHDTRTAATASNLSDLPPTPMYNLAILEDMTPPIHHRILLKTLADNSILRDALTLFKMWLTQRSLRFNVDGFDGHHAAILLAYLLQIKRIQIPAATHSFVDAKTRPKDGLLRTETTAAASFNVFYSMLTFISESNWTDEIFDMTSVSALKRSSPGPYSLHIEGHPLLFHPSNPHTEGWSMQPEATAPMANSILDRPALLLHPIASQSSGAVDSDASPGRIPYNVLWRVSGSGLLEVQDEARRSVQEIRNQNALPSPSSVAGQVHPTGTRPTGTHQSSFEYLFTKQRPFLHRHDLCLTVDVTPRPQLPSSGSPSGPPASLDPTHLHSLLHFPAHLFSSEAIHNLVTHALGDRALSVRTQLSPVPVPRQPAIQDWSSHPCLSPLHRTRGYVVTVGIVLDERKASRRVERCPSHSEGTSSDVKTAELRFRWFWGDEVIQLRRFQDGSIVESVVWSGIGEGSGKTERGSDSSQVSREMTTLLSQSSISPSSGLAADQLASDIIHHILNRHMQSFLLSNPVSIRGVLPSIVTHLSTAVSLVPSLVPGLVPGLHPRPSPGGYPLTVEAAYREAIAAFEGLRGILTSQMKGLPVRMDSVVAMSSNLRSTSLQPPLPHPIVKGGQREDLKPFVGRTVSMMVQPLWVLGRLESSGKWPLAAEAIRQTKTALLLRIRKLLRSQFQVESIVHRNCLDICYLGYLFRLTLMSSNDEIERLGSLTHHPGPEEIIPETSLETKELGYQAVLSSTVVLPGHHNSIKSMAGPFPCYPAAVRLLRHWVASHYLSGHFDQECLELMVAAVFLHSDNVHPPTTATAAFSQTLRLLCTHRWEEEPLIVDFGVMRGSTDGTLGEVKMSPTTHAQIVSQYREMRDPSSTSKRLKRTESDLRPSSESPLPQDRPLSPPIPSMYIVSSNDSALGYRSVWFIDRTGSDREPYPYRYARSRSAPQRIVLKLAIQSALQTLETIRNQHTLSALRQPDSLMAVYSCWFQSETASIIRRQFDAVLRFNPNLKVEDYRVGSRLLPIGSLEIFSNLSRHETGLETLVITESMETSLHPLQQQIVLRLQCTYRESALFFWNELKGKEIGIIWKPNLFLPKSFTILGAAHHTVLTEPATSVTSTPPTGRMMMIPNVAELLADMIEMSEGILESTEIVAFSNAMSVFEALSCQIIGISGDSEHTLLAWCNTSVLNGGVGEIKFPLVSDFSKSIGKSYGVQLSDGMILPATILISPEGIIRHCSINDTEVGRNIDEFIRLVEEYHFFLSQEQRPDRRSDPMFNGLIGKHVEKTTTSSYSLYSLTDPHPPMSTPLSSTPWTGTTRVKFTRGVLEYPVLPHDAVMTSAVAESWPSHIHRLVGDGIAWYQHRLQQDPVLTKSVTSCLLAILGEMIGGFIRQSKTDHTGRRLDWRQRVYRAVELKRIVIFGLKGLVITGPFYHWWYPVLDSITQQTFRLVDTLITPPSPDKETETTTMTTTRPSPVRVWSQLFFKLAFNQLVLTPPVLLFTLFYLQVLFTWDISQTLRNIKRTYAIALYSNWKLWTPAQLLNFYLIPINYRVLFGNMIGLWWNVYLSMVSS